MTNKIKIHHVEIPFSEFFGDKYKGKHFTLKEANEIIFSISRGEMRQNGVGYSKTDFVIIWEDAGSYMGRLDVTGKDEFQNLSTIQNHIKGLADFYTGKHQPSHYTDTQYKELMEMDYIKAAKKEYEEILEKYELE